MKPIPLAYQCISDCVETLRDYADNGIPTGDFLHAVLSNDLREAFGRADEFNRANMFPIVSYCWNHLPALCWGSPEKVTAWLDFKRQQREMEGVSKR